VAAPLLGQWGPFSLVAAIAAFRSGAYFGLQAFVPSYFIAHFAPPRARATPPSQ